MHTLWRTSYVTLFYLKTLVDLNIKFYINKLVASEVQASLITHQIILFLLYFISFFGQGLTT